LCGEIVRDKLQQLYNLLKNNEWSMTKNLLPLATRKCFFIWLKVEIIPLQRNILHCREIQNVLRLIFCDFNCEVVPFLMIFIKIDI
jgi:hypothetical protein